VTPEVQEHPWSRPAAEVAEALEVDAGRGLSSDEAERRLAEHGPNRLREQERRGALTILWHQLKSLIILLLALAGGVSLAMGDVAAAVAIGVVIVANTAIGFWMELRAVRSMESLRRMGEAEVHVRRDGVRRTVPARELVPGDVVLLEQGDVVAADLRLLEARGLRVDESSLTGESVPVDKDPEAQEEDVPLAERRSMAWRGTTVRRGEGVGVVARTGMDTELGDISSMVAEAESEEPPLDERLDRLGRRLVWLTLAVAAVVALAGVAAGRDLVLMVETGIALAVAAIPEGLAIVATVALARGMHRMMDRNALVRRLSAVETLGSTTVVCADKTGTLTRNRMTVRTLVSPAGSRELEEGGEDRSRGGDGPEPESGDALPDEAPGEADPLRPLLLAAVLATEGRLPEGGDPGRDAGGVAGSGDAEEEDAGAGPGGRGDGGGGSGDPDGSRAAGDPMDLALLRMGRDLGLPWERLAEERPLERTVSFDRSTGMMASLHRGEGSLLVAAKGAPESVLKASTRRLDDDGGTVEMDGAAREDWLERSRRMAADGLRVLAVADGRAEEADADPYRELRFLGLVGFLDPPRDDVEPAIRACQRAGIRVVMVTGDHPETARHVAAAVGLGPADELTVVEGMEPARDGGGLGASVYARVDPGEKLSLVEALQGQGEILAMTGDGVNDAPAIRKADIGIAMGERGTEVAREASDMVLLDDAFSTIVAAVEQGRTIFRNIRKFVVYLLSGNVGEILAVGAAAVAALPLPLLPLQILYLNLVNDVLPALALGVGPENPAFMDRPPRDPSEDILERHHWWLIVGWGALIAAVVLGVFLLALEGLGRSPEEAVTVSFLGLSAGRLLHAFNMREPDSGLLKNEISRNPAVWGAIAVSLGLLAVAVLIPPLAEVLELVRPDGTALLLAGGAALAILLLGQAYLLVRGTAAGSGTDDEAHPPPTENPS
jgi:Ca2+-transporting ATPase